MDRAPALLFAAVVVIAAFAWAQASGKGKATAPVPDRGLPSKPYPKPSKDELSKKLTPEQFHVALESGTEPPFRNAYWNNHEAGLYVDITTGEPLFSSTDKFDSGTGWPSFTRPVQNEVVVEKSDGAFGMLRTEVRSKSGDAHLGHVFNDGPRDRGGLRYCINSASLRFIPVAKLEAEGYGAYAKLFEAPAK
jgi:peptide methionine sulfoxide reductase msrA/msrB